MGGQGSGPRPKSQYDHELRGTHRKDRHGAMGSEPRAVGALTKPNFGEDSFADYCWDTITAFVTTMNVGEVDQLPLSMAAQIYGEFRRSLCALQSEDVETTIYKRVRSNATQLFAMLDSILSRYGYTPADRAKLRNLPDDEEVDQFEALQESMN